MTETPYDGTYRELEDLARQINAYQGYADQAEKRRTEAIETESKNIEFELDRVRKCQDRLRILLQELGLADAAPASLEAVPTGAASVIQGDK